MSRHIPYGLAVLLGAGLLLREGADALGQGAQPKSPLWTHAFDLKVRKYGEAQFSDKTKTFGVEVFKDANNDNGVYICETGALAVVRGFGGVKSPVPESKSPAWLHGLDLKVRKAGEAEFSDKTQVFGVEVFRDENTGNLVYITEKGSFAVAPGDKAARAPTPSPRAPVWTHGLDLKVRRAGEKEFDNNTKVWSVEVFRDENTGMLIYICETGAVAVAAGEPPAPGAKSKAPDWLHGLDLKCRKGRQMNFDPNTKVYGIEVFRDNNNGNLIYICETGTLSVVPGGGNLKAPTAKPREPAWTHGLDLKCRHFGEAEFSDKTQVFGVEVFRDENTGSVVYISQTGSVSAAPGKQ
jgi:hypothetical protein